MNQNNEPPKVIIEEEKGWQAVKYYREPTTPKMITLVMKYSGGMIKNHRQAEYVLLGLVILAIIISLFLFFGGGENISKKPSSDLINRPQPREGYIPR